MISFAKKQLNNIEMYTLPIAAFFLLISTGALTTFMMLSAIFGTFRIRKNHYMSETSKKFILYGFSIFIFLVLSQYYTVGSDENILKLLAPYSKFLYIPLLFYYIKELKTMGIVSKKLLLNNFQTDYSYQLIRDKFVKYI